MQRKKVAERRRDLPGAYTRLNHKSGQLLNTGYQTWNTLAWRDIATLSIGDYALCGVMENGQPLSTRAELVTSDYYDLVSFDAATANSAGLKADGTVVSNGLNVSTLSSILAIDCTPNGIYALDDGGRVHAIAFSYAHLPDVSDWTNIVAISASATHVVGVRRMDACCARGEQNRAMRYAGVGALYARANRNAGTICYAGAIMGGLR